MSQSNTYPPPHPTVTSELITADWAIVHDASRDELLSVFRCLCVRDPNCQRFFRDNIMAYRDWAMCQIQRTLPLNESYPSHVNENKQSNALSNLDQQHLVAIPQAQERMKHQPFDHPAPTSDPLAYTSNAFFEGLPLLHGQTTRQQPQQPRWPSPREPNSFDPLHGVFVKTSGGPSNSKRKALSSIDVNVNAPREMKKIKQESPPPTAPTDPDICSNCGKDLDSEENAIDGGRKAAVCYHHTGSLHTVQGYKDFWDCCDMERDDEEADDDGCVVARHLGEREWGGECVCGEEGLGEYMKMTRFGMRSMKPFSVL